MLQKKGAADFLAMIQVGITVVARQLAPIIESFAPHAVNDQININKLALRVTEIDGRRIAQIKSYEIW